MDKKTIRAFDDYAATWAQKIRSGDNLAHTFLEKPAMYEKLPYLKGKSVLCVGSGTGEECEHVASNGAKRVVGIDISEGLIRYAKKSYPHLEFHVMDMEKLDFPAGCFDFVYSSLAMHYLRNWSKTLGGIYDVLKSGGTFLFSTHHPVRWGADINRSKRKDTFIIGYEKYGSGESKVYGDYFTTRKIDDIWFDDFRVSYYHRSLSEIFRDITKSGFFIADFIEPKPQKSVLNINPEFYEIHSKIPLFIIFELTKKKR